MVRNVSRKLKDRVSPSPSVLIVYVDSEFPGVCGLDFLGDARGSRLFPRKSANGSGASLEIGGLFLHFADICCFLLVMRKRGKGQKGKLVI